MTEQDTKTEEQNGENKNIDKDLESAIIRQVEYYFGDVNLPRDKFLREQVKLDEGWIPLDVMTRFNRLANLSKDTKVIADALKKSVLIEVSADDTKVRRNPEVPVPEMNEERRKELLSRTVYAKGFPKESALDDLLEYFKTHGEVENVIMRRYLDKASNDRKFKGSVFTTFKNKEDADKFVESKELKYKDTELVILWQENYLTKKQEEYMARKDKKNNKQEKKEPALEQFKLHNGTLLHFSECDEKTSRELIRDALTALGAEIAFIDYNLGDKEGCVRLTKENAAKEIFEKIEEGKMKIGEAEIKFRLVEGEEEKAFLEKTINEMVKRRQNSRNNKQKGNRNFRGKPQGRKRKQDQHRDAPASKVKAD